MILKLLAITIISITAVNWARADFPKIVMRLDENSVSITSGGEPLMTYVFRDETITRPYFAHVRVGNQLTRNHPPVDGEDATDHATFHPGIWMSFGDINGHDYWRLRAKTEHVEFVEKPAGNVGEGSFAVRNRYLSSDGKRTVCNEVARYRIVALSEPAGSYLLLWDSAFSSDEHDFYFGDQEEMGLGVRVATPLAVKAQQGGFISNSQGQRNEREVWGKAARWCDYGGKFGNRRLGMTMFPHPDNFRPCWFHARDYGFVAANPFGRKAFGAGPPSKVAVAQGENLRLRFGVLLYATRGRKQIDYDAILAEYLEIANRWVE